MPRVQYIYNYIQTIYFKRFYSLIVKLITQRLCHKTAIDVEIIKHSLCILIFRSETAKLM